MSILEEIYKHKRVQVSIAKMSRPFEELEQRAKKQTSPPSFIEAIQDQTRTAPRLIAEVKHRSPSRGTLVQKFDPLQLAEIYEQNGAAAISVLTDERYFGGSLEYLEDIANALPNTPLLRKDFIFDPYQILEARCAGASAVLLIVAMLKHEELQRLILFAHENQLKALVEIHQEDELEPALSAGARLLGINNRNLHNFDVNLDTTFKLLPMIPPEVAVVSESGIRTSQDVERLGKAGVDAILVGEALVTAKDVAAQVAYLCRVRTT